MTTTALRAHRALHAVDATTAHRRLRARRVGVIVAACILALPVGWVGYFAIRWATYGQLGNTATADSLMNRFMPHHEVVELHQARILAPPTITSASVRAMNLDSSRVVRAMFRGRGLLMGAQPPRRETRPLYEQLRRLGWGIMYESPRQIVFGAVTQPWRGDVTFSAVLPDSFARFDRPGYAKILVSFAVDSIAPDVSVFRTETRVQTTDTEARGKFRRYWSFLSPGIVLIRMEGLRLVRGAAERQHDLLSPSRRQ